MGLTSAHFSQAIVGYTRGITISASQNGKELLASLKPPAALPHNPPKAATVSYGT